MRKIIRYFNGRTRNNQARGLLKFPWVMLCFTILANVTRNMLICTLHNIDSYDFHPRDVISYSSTLCIQWSTISYPSFGGRSRIVDFVSPFVRWRSPWRVAFQFLRLCMIKCKYPDSFTHHYLWKNAGNKKYLWRTKGAGWEIEIEGRWWGDWQWDGCSSDGNSGWIKRQGSMYLG